MYVSQEQPNNVLCLPIDFKILNQRLHGYKRANKNAITIKALFAIYSPIDREISDQLFSTYVTIQTVVCIASENKIWVLINWYFNSQSDFHDNMKLSVLVNQLNLRNI